MINFMQSCISHLRSLSNEATLCPSIIIFLGQLIWKIGNLGISQSVLKFTLTKKWVVSHVRIWNVRNVYHMHENDNAIMQCNERGIYCDRLPNRRQNSQRFDMFISIKLASTSLFLFFRLFSNILCHIHLLLLFFQSVTWWPWAFSAFWPHQNSQPHYAVFDFLFQCMRIRSSIDWVSRCNCILPRVYVALFKGHFIRRWFHLAHIY